VKKLLHDPTLRLRAIGHRDDGLPHLESARYLFGLGESDDGLAPVVPIDRTPAVTDG
jgi:hypothetical protein